MPWTFCILLCCRALLQAQLLCHAAVMLVTHSIYSAFKYYNTKMMPGINEWATMFWTDLKEKKTMVTFFS